MQMVKKIRVKRMGKQLEVLITSGGTISKIDDVRHIGNFSEGTTGALIAEEFLKKGWVVHYVHNKRARTPYSEKMTIKKDRPIFGEIYKAMRGVYNHYKNKGRLHEYPIETFEEYYDMVKKVVSEKDIDTVILAAAVSDYGAKKVEGKISSDKENISVELVKYPKIISEIKKWKNDVYQVGFKLLSNTTREDMIGVAYAHGQKNNNDLTVANRIMGNDFANRDIILITPNKNVYPVSSRELPKSIYEMANSGLKRI